MKILLVEDDSKTAQAIRTGLHAEGCFATIARTGDEGLAAFAGDAFDLVVLDWMLPGKSGLEILRAVRSQGRRTPVILLTARGTVEDRVLGLESGADDYLVKPFAFAELLARIRALSRRVEPKQEIQMSFADLRVDLSTRRAWRGSRKISTTPREMDLLVYLMRSAGEIVTREMLARDVWREPNRVTPLDNVIDVHITHLRRKIDDGCEVKLIHTVRGVGFILREGGAS